MENLPTIWLVGAVFGAWLQGARALETPVAWGDEGITGPFVYRSSGRRDPFVPLRRGPSSERRRCGGSGLRAVRVGEVAVKGIVRTRAGYVALLAGPSSESHFARVGAVLCDGSVRGIQPAAVTFDQDTDVVGAPGGVPRVREIRMRLHTE